MVPPVLSPGEHALPVKGVLVCPGYFNGAAGAISERRVLMVFQPDFDCGVHRPSRSDNGGFLPRFSVMPLLVLPLLFVVGGGCPT